MKKLNWSILFLIISIPFLTVSCDEEEDEFTPSSEETIYEVIQADGRFDSLLVAIEATGLENALPDLEVALRESGTYTLFAPTNEAFQSFLSTNGFANLNEAVDAVGKEGLKKILLYHLLGDEVMAADVSAGYTNTLAELVEGEGDYLDMRITTDNGVMIDKKATVIETDINALNGVIHVIDNVISPRNIVEVAQGNDDFTSLVDALGQANSAGSQGDLIPVLSADSSLLTVFAPTDDAFADIQTTVDGLTDEELADVLLHHVVSGNVSSDELSSGTVTTLNGDVQVTVTDNGVSIESETGNTANVVLKDIQTTSGVIHVIDAVLVPQL